MEPALAAIITRQFFFDPRFRDANLHFGDTKDYDKIGLISIGITALSYVFFSAFGSVSWDFTGQAFLAQQFEAAGQAMYAALSP